MSNHQAGNYAVAEQLYRQIIQVDQRHANAHHLLGVVAYQTGRAEQAVQLITRALGLQPSTDLYHFNLGAALAALGRLDEAIMHYEQALRLDPNFPEVHNNFGNALYRQGKLHEAMMHLHEALRQRPDYPEAINNLGIVLDRQGRTQDAMLCYQQALRLKPDYAEPHNNLGSVLERQGRLDEALACFQQALRLRPDYAEAISNLGIVAYRRNNLAEAIKHYETALQLDPGLAVARWNRSLLYLLHGDFVRGWVEYEWRWTQPSFGRRTFTQPRWDGSRLDGRTIFIYAEQGLGDTLQFIRFAPLLQNLGGKVVFECQPSLLRLLAGVDGIDHLLAIGTAAPPFDVQAPLVSLPGIFRTNLESVPNNVPYVKAEPELVERWRRKLQSIGGRRIGIVWQGNPANTYDGPRSMPLTCFAKLAEIEGVQLISLQHGPGTDQLRAMAGAFPVFDLTAELGDGCESLANIGAILTNIDLVISCDTAIAHLAGAMGRPAWTLLPLVPDWRWQLGREDTPWYPGMRLFRQPAPAIGKTSSTAWQASFAQ